MPVDLLSDMECRYIPFPKGLRVQTFNYSRGGTRKASEGGSWCFDALVSNTVYYCFSVFDLRLQQVYGKASSLWCLWNMEQYFWRQAEKAAWALTKLPLSAPSWKTFWCQQGRNQPSTVPDQMVMLSSRLKSNSKQSDPFGWIRGERVCGNALGWRSPLHPSPLKKKAPLSSHPACTCKKGGVGGGKESQNQFEKL